MDLLKPTPDTAIIKIKIFEKWNKENYIPISDVARFCAFVLSQSKRSHISKSDSNEFITTVYTHNNKLLKSLAGIILAFKINIEDGVNIIFSISIKTSELYIMTLTYIDIYNYFNIPFPDINEDYVLPTSITNLIN